MTTIWVKHAGEADSSNAHHIDYEIADVAQWLSSIHGGELDYD
jgi:hypothetical protein